jgi:5'-nucleotidase
VAHLLVTNDDGIDSPALVPLARALSALSAVEVVVPAVERSWVSKAVTRHDEVIVERVERAGLEMWTTSGYPADCVQIGIHGLFSGPPQAVVSGINIGFNFGAAYILSSGTIGAAAEAWVSGVPAFAFSTGTMSGWPAWARWARSPESADMWHRLAGVAAAIVDRVTTIGIPHNVDVVNVNLPQDADESTRRVVTSVARVGYDRLFSRAREEAFVHDFGGGFVEFGDLSGSDIATARAGDIAITPLRVHHAATVDDEFRRAVET